MRTPLLLALLGLATPVLQESGGSAQTLRSAVDLVRVDVTVLDARGRPVAGLTKEDFAIVEGGRELAIAAVVPVFGAGRVVEQYGDSIAPSQQARNLFVVVLDDLMLRVGNGALYRTKRVFREFVAQLSPTDSVAVLSTSGAAQHQVQFTSDKAALLRALDGLMPRSEQPPADPSSTEPASGSLEPSELWKTRTSAAVVKQAIEQLAVIKDARKAVVLISEGLPYDLLARGGIASEVRMAITAMADTGRAADVPVYAFDPGIVTSPPGYAPQNLRLVSEQTGGRLVPSTANLGAAIGEMLAAQRSYYIVAFHPTDATRGSTHTFGVKVDRPGVTVRSRREYVVAPARK